MMKIMTLAKGMHHYALLNFLACINVCKIFRSMHYMPFDGINSVSGHGDRSLINIVWTCRQLFVMHYIKSRLILIQIDQS